MHVILSEHGIAVGAERPSPPLRPGCVRILVHAAGVNRADLVQKAGHYPPPPGASDILGLEVAGEVAEIGQGVTRFRKGDAVTALLAGGGYAEEVVVEQGCVLPIPRGLDMVQAAAITEVWATAWLNLGRIAGLATTPSGARVLIHAGASGVGSAAVQLCRELGHRSFVTLGSDEKLARCLALGADAGFNRHTGDWQPAVQAWAPQGVQAVLDPVGAAYLAQDLAVLAPDACLVLIGLMGGREAQIPLGALLSKRIRLQGSTLRARSLAFKADLLAELEAWAWPRFECGAIQPIVDRTFPLAEAEGAHRHVASNHTFGAVVLTVKCP